MTTIILDTNIILRLLRKDSIELSKNAKVIFDRASEGKILLYVDELALAEVVWNLLSFYKETKENVVDLLLDLISQDWIINSRKGILLETLRLYKNENLSYVDCWLAVLAKDLGYKLETFDKKLKKLSES